jgi:hypothetical protein
MAYLLCYTSRINEHFEYPYLETPRSDLYIYNKYTGNNLEYLMYIDVGHHFDEYRKLKIQLKYLIYSNCNHFAEPLVFCAFSNGGKLSTRAHYTVCIINYNIYICIERYNNIVYKIISIGYFDYKPWIILILNLFGEIINKVINKYYYHPANEKLFIEYLTTNKYKSLLEN